MQRSRSNGTISRLATLISPTTVPLEMKSTPRKQKEEHLKHWSIFILVIISVLIRYTVALGPHSGENTPPMYGDYEAQRHWMEITVNTPPNEWYQNTTDNDLNYWGLDYPPGSARRVVRLHRHKTEQLTGGANPSSGRRGSRARGRPHVVLR